MSAGRAVSFASLVRTSIAVSASSGDRGDAGDSAFLCRPSTARHAALACQFVRAWVAQDAAVHDHHRAGLKELVMAAAVRAEPDAWSVVCWAVAILHRMCSGSGSSEPPGSALDAFVSELAAQLDGAACGAAGAAGGEGVDGDWANEPDAPLLHGGEADVPKPPPPPPPPPLRRVDPDAARATAAFLVDSLTTFYRRAQARTALQSRVVRLDGVLLDTAPELVALLLPAWPYAAEVYQLAVADAALAAAAAGADQGIALRAWVADVAGDASATAAAHAARCAPHLRPASRRQLSDAVLARVRAAADPAASAPSAAAAVAAAAAFVERAIGCAEA